MPIVAPAPITGVISKEVTKDSCDTILSVAVAVKPFAAFAVIVTVPVELVQRVLLLTKCALLVFEEVHVTAPIFSEVSGIIVRKLFIFILVCTGTVAF